MKVTSPSARRWLPDGTSAVPLLVLFGLNLVDELDRIAFAALTPEIRDTFDLSDTGIGAIGSVSGVLILLLALPIGFVGDRLNRVRTAAAAAVLWGTASVLTGVVPTVLLLFVVRLVAGIGRITNEVVHPSLLADYYRLEDHPRVFQLHRLANPLSALSGVAAGALGAALGWRWTFVLLAVPTFVLVTTLIRLREPARGESIDADLARRAAEQEPISAGEARRQLGAVRTLRRMWAGAFFLGFGIIPIGQLLSLFFEHVYDFGPFGRGAVQAVLGAGTILGLAAGGVLAGRATAAGATARLALITGLSFVFFGVGLVAMAAAPWAGLSVLCAFVLAAGIGSYQPAYFALVGQVAPPQVRSQAYAYAILFVGIGGVGSVSLFELGEDIGYRGAIMVLSVLIALAGLISASATRFVAHDVDAATAALTAAMALRDELTSTGERAILTCRGVEAAYDQVQVLFGVDIEVRPGEILALLGTNGAGKSTLLNAISGSLDPIGGVIFFDGRDVTHADAASTSALGIVQVPGGKGVFPSLTVAENLAMAGWLFRRDRARVQAATAEVLEMFPRLAERIEQPAGNLSGGEQQMLALSMAFIARPKLLMIDELSLGLAPAIVEQLLGIVRRIAAQGVAIILVEQSINVALTVAERAYFLEKGEVRFEGRTADLLTRDDIARSVFLKGATHRSPADRRGSSVPLAPPGRPLLEVRGLTKHFGGIAAVDDVTFTLRDGQILGVIGANGAGKTTVFDLLSGFLAADRGTVCVDGFDVTDLRPATRARLGLARSFQDARLYPSLTVRETLALALARQAEVHDPVASALALPAAVRSEKRVHARVDELLEVMGLEAFADKFVGELSTGTRRIVDLACVVALDPKVLLFDEPSSGIAQRETEALGPLLVQIKEATGASMLVIEHDIPMISSVADELLALDLGRVIVRDTPERVVTHPMVVAAYLGSGQEAVARSGEHALPRTRRRREPLTARSAP